MQQFFNKVEVPYVLFVRLIVEGQNANAVNENYKMAHREHFSQLSTTRYNDGLVIVIAQVEDNFFAVYCLLNIVPHKEANLLVKNVRAQVKVAHEIKARGETGSAQLLN